MAAGSFAELSTFMKDQQALLLEEQKEARQETEAKLEARMEEQLQQMHDQMQEQRQQIEELKAPQEAISARQVEALAARLEAMHAAEMLSDAELFAVEDCVADFVEGPLVACPPEDQHRPTGDQLLETVPAVTLGEVVSADDPAEIVLRVTVGQGLQRIVGAARPLEVCLDLADPNPPRIQRPQGPLHHRHPIGEGHHPLAEDMVGGGRHPDLVDVVSPEEPGHGEEVTEVRRVEGPPVQRDAGHG